MGLRGHGEQHDAGTTNGFNLRLDGKFKRFRQVGMPGRTAFSLRRDARLRSAASGTHRGRAG
jgi:hypothetical protein